MGWDEIDRAARAHHGAVHRRTVVGAGIGERQVTRLAAKQSWRRLHQGVYALPGARPTVEQRLAAALLAVGPPVLVTGAAALRLYQVLSGRPDRLELLVPASRAPYSREGIAIIRTRAFDAVTRVRVHGFPVAHVTRALADHARDAEAVTLARQIARAVALRRCTLDQIEAELAARRRFPGRAALRTALALLRGELNHSRDEATGRRLLRAAGLHPHPRPYPIVVGGRPIAEADIALPDLRYDIEIDGPHHDLPEQIAADKARDRLLGRHGWTVDRFPVELIRHHPNRFVHEVLARVAQLRQTIV